MMQTHFKKRSDIQVAKAGSGEYPPGPVDHPMNIVKDRRYGFIPQPRFKKRRAY
ncbi:hypothetical protein SDC9_32827 [bioreactor metagenome]|uniref:Uncharacterized protein n=1 Tax=bioreactor metagenome TaxID=1076179 RepID=A0A644V667_9ZZZZ